MCKGIQINFDKPIYENFNSIAIKKDPKELDFYPTLDEIKSTKCSNIPFKNKHCKECDSLLDD